MSKKPTPPDFNILDYYESRIKNLPRGFQACWLRFEYIRRNDQYREDWLSYIDALYVDHKNFGKWINEHDTASQLLLRKKRRELIEKWGVPYLFNPDHPLPKLVDIQQDHGYKRNGLSLQIKDIKKGKTIQDWSYDCVLDQSLPLIWIHPCTPKELSRKFKAGKIPYYKDIPEEAFGLIYPFQSPLQKDSDPISLFVLGFKDFHDLDLHILADSLWEKIFPAFLVQGDKTIIDLSEFHDRKLYQWVIKDRTKSKKIDGNVFDLRPPIEVLQSGETFCLNDKETARQMEEKYLNDPTIRAFDHFTFWNNGPFVEWNDSEWILLAINRRASNKQIKKSISNILKNIAGKTTRQSIEKHVERLLIWDQKQLNISEDEIKKSIPSLDESKNYKDLIRKQVDTVNSDIRGGFKKIN